MAVVQIEIRDDVGEADDVRGNAMVLLRLGKVAAERRGRNVYTRLKGRVRPEVFPDEVHRLHEGRAEALIVCRGVGETWTHGCAGIVGALPLLPALDEVVERR